MADHIRHDVVVTFNYATIRYDTIPFLVCAQTLTRSQLNLHCTKSTLKN